MSKVLIMYALKSAIEKAKEIKDNLEKEIENYKVNKIMIEEDKYVCFFLRDDNILKEELGLLK